MNNQYNVFEDNTLNFKGADMSELYPLKIIHLGVEIQKCFLNFTIQEIKKYFTFFCKRHNITAPKQGKMYLSSQGFFTTNEKYVNKSKDIYDHIDVSFLIKSLSVVR